MVKKYGVVLALLAVGISWLVAGNVVQRTGGFASLSSNAALAAWREDEDFYYYFTGRGWIQWGRVLYENGYAEYPTLGLMYVNWPKFVVGDFSAYQWWLRLSNLVLYVAAGWLTWRLASGWAPASAWWAWLLPSALYFSLNVFDIFPVCLVLASLYLVRQQHFRSGWFVYGLAIMAKVYPVALLPLYWWLTTPAAAGPRRLWPYPLYALAAVVGLTLGTIASGGLPAAVVLYGMQVTRAAEPGSLLFSLLTLWPALPAYRPALHALFHLLQLFIPLWWLVRTWLARNLSMANHLTLAALSLLGLTLFNPFYSSQWWLWALPFVVFILPRRQWWLLVCYDALVYLQLPIAFQLFGWSSSAFTAVVLVRSGVLAFTMAVLWRQLPKRWWVLL